MESVTAHVGGGFRKVENASENAEESGIVSRSLLELVAQWTEPFGDGAVLSAADDTSGVEVDPVDSGATTTQHTRCCRRVLSNLIWVTAVKSTSAKFHAARATTQRPRPARGALRKRIAIPSFCSS